MSRSDEQQQTLVTEVGNTSLSCRMRVGSYLVLSDVRPGLIHVCMGPMFSGKSSWLGRHAQRAMYGPKRTSLLVMPEMNDRDPPGGITTHNKVTIPMKNIRVTSLAEAVLREDKDLMRADEIFVEEAQFIPDQLAWACEQLALLGKNVYVSVLTSTYKRDLWDGTRMISEVADHIDHLKAICECGAEAAFSSKLKPDAEAAKRDKDGSNTVIETGAEDKYASHCRVCYLKHRSVTIGDITVSVVSAPLS